VKKELQIGETAAKRIVDGRGVGVFLYLKFSKDETKDKGVRFLSALKVKQIPWRPGT
jgi:hypothetical protein